MILHETWCVLRAFAPWLLLGALVSGLMHAYLPRSFMGRVLRGRRGVLAGVAVGIPLPLCSCGVIPAALGLKKDGASDGATMGFLISTPQTGVDSIMVSAAFLGWPFALFKVAGAALTGLVGGALAERVTQSPPTPYDAAQQDDALPGLREGLGHAMTVMRSIWGWIVVGIVLSALITVYLPKESVSSVVGLGAIAISAGILALSVPLYVCNTASVPIAAALVAAGLPTGAALIFLMAGPATNIATLGAVYQALGRRMLAVYLSTIVLGSIALAWVFDAMFGQLGQVNAQTAGHDGGLVHELSAYVLIGLLAWFAMEALRGYIRDDRPTASADEVTFAVDGMTCGGCTRRLTSTLEKLDGAEHVTVSLQPGRAQVIGSVSDAMVRQAIEDAGFKIGPST
ncbi:MAG: permease [Myxococcota bacterium]|nr:permease [Myxococcota bacterium]